MTPRRVVIEEPVSLSLGKYLDDPSGLREVLEAVDGLAENPRLPAAVPWGPVLSRLHTGRYRVIYEIGADVISIRRIDRDRQSHQRRRRHPAAPLTAAPRRDLRFGLRNSPKIGVTCGCRA